MQFFSFQFISDNRRDPDYDKIITPYLKKLRLEGNYSNNVLSALENAKSEDLNLALIHDLVKNICRSQPPGAILIFLPGWSEISNLVTRLEEDYFFDEGRFSF